MSSADLPERRASGPALRRFFVTRQDVACTLPRAHEVEFPELLHEFDWLIDHALELVVIPNFDVTGEREILRQRIAGTAIIREQPAEIGMVGESDAVHIEGLTLE